MSYTGELINAASQAILDYGSAVKSRFNIKALGGSMAAAIISGTPLIASQAVLTYGFNEVFKDNNPALLSYMGIGLLGLNILSIAIERKTLLKKKSSNNPISNTLYLITGKPTLSSVLSHVIHLVEFGIPSSLVLKYLLSNNELRIYFVNLTSISTSIAIYNLITNYIILKFNKDSIKQSFANAENRKFKKM